MKVICTLFESHSKSVSFILFCVAGSVQIIWSKEDAKSTQIAIGTTVVAREYMDRASVTVDDSGSTLYIGIAKSEDAGKYKCSIAVRGEKPEQSHEVRIRGKISD